MKQRVVAKEKMMEFNKKSEDLFEEIKINELNNTKKDIKNGNIEPKTEQLPQIKAPITQPKK